VELRDFGDFYRRIDVSTMATSFQLRKLTLPCYTRSFKSTLVKLLKHCPYLVELGVEVYNFNEAFEDIETELSNLSCLERLVLHRFYDAVDVQVSRCKIQSMSTDLYFWPPSPCLLLQKSYLTELSATPDPGHETLLTDLIRWNPRLRAVDFDCSMEYSQILMDTITSTRQGILSEEGHWMLHHVQLLLCDLESFIRNGFAILLNFRDGSTSPTIWSSFTGLTVLPAGDKSDTPKPLLDALLQYGWFFRFLIVRRHFHDELAAILDKVTEQTSNITWFSLGVACLTNVGFETMVKVVHRSHNLQRFESTFKELDDKCQQEKLELLIRGCSKRFTALDRRGDSADVWVLVTIVLYPTRAASTGSLHLGWR